MSVELGEVSTSGIVIAIIVVVLLLAYIAFLIVRSRKSLRRGKDLLGTHPDVARIYTRVGTSAAGTMGAALKQSIGATAEVGVSSINGKAADLVQDPSGIFTPVLAGHYNVRVTARISHPGFRPELQVADIVLSLAPYQCVVLDYDKSTKSFTVQEAGFSYQFASTV